MVVELKSYSIISDNSNHVARRARKVMGPQWIARLPK
jgi:hypothetical protein